MNIIGLLLDQYINPFAFARALIFRSAVLRTQVHMTSLDLSDTRLLFQSPFAAESSFIGKSLSYITLP